MEYFKLPIIFFSINKNITFDIYIKQSNDYVLYSTIQNFNENSIFKLNSNGIEFVYIKKSDYVEYNNYVTNNLPLLLKDPTIEIKQKGKIIYEHSLEITKNLFNTSENNIVDNLQYQQILSLVDNIFMFITSSFNGLHTLEKLISYNYHDYVHSINTSIYSMSLFLYDSILNNDITPRKSEVKQLGIGAILHDIGKTKWPKELLNKDKLTTLDIEEIRKHPIYGIEMCNLMNMDNIIINTVLFHHEKLDGTGYPCGTKNMNKYAKIVSICDVFTAMTCDRPYRQKHSTFDTLKYLKLQAESGKMDSSLIMSFIKLVSINHFKI